MNFWKLLKFSNKAKVTKSLRVIEEVVKVERYSLDLLEGWVGSTFSEEVGKICRHERWRREGSKVSRWSLIYVRSSSRKNWSYRYLIENMNFVLEGRLQLLRTVFSSRAVFVLPSSSAHPSPHHSVDEYSRHLPQYCLSECQAMKIPAPHSGAGHSRRRRLIFPSPSTL